MSVLDDFLANVNTLKSERNSYATTLTKVRSLLGVTDPAVTSTAALQKVLDDYNRLKSQATSTPVVPGAGGTIITPSGFKGRSTNVDPMWKKAFEDDFPYLAPEGGFLGTYNKWNAYPNYYFTTNADPSKGGNGDHYETKNLSVIDTPDGVRALNCHLLPKSMTPDGKNWGAAPYPNFDIGLGNARAKNIKVELRFRVAKLVPKWHLANLLWFDDIPWPGGGEDDFLELDTDGTIGAWFHYFGAKTGGDQIRLESGIRPDDWHVVGFERIGGKSWKLFVDGKQIGNTITSRVGDAIGRLVLQNEPAGSPTEPADIQYDWITVWTA